MRSRAKEEKEKKMKLWFGPTVISALMVGRDARHRCPSINIMTIIRCQSVW